MSSLKAAYYNEIYKLSKKKKIVVAAILSTAAILIACIAVKAIGSYTGIRVTGATAFPVLALSVLSYTLIPLFTAFFCIDMFGGEFADSTIKLTLTGPVSRFRIYLAKSLAAATFIMANLLFVLMLSAIASLVTHSLSMGFFKIVLAYFAAFLPIFVFALAVMLLSNLIRGTTLAFMVSVLVFLLFNILGMAFTNYQSFFFTSMFDWYTLFLGSYVNYQKIFRVLIILLSCGTMLFTAGYYVFEKKDI